MPHTLLRASIIPSLLVIGELCLLASTTRAQLPATRLHRLSQPFAQVGTSLTLTMEAGTDLEELDTLRVDHPEITAEPVYTGEGDAQKRVDKQFLVTVGADVPPGLYEVRTSGVWGMSNPRLLRLGTEAVVVETEPNDLLAEAKPLALNTLWYGRTNHGADVDHIRFTVTAGQTIVARCLTESVDSRMLPVLSFLDAEGRPLSVMTDLSEGDTNLAFTAPADGDYILHVTDQAYGSGEQYGLILDTRPVLIAAMPPVGQAGTNASIDLLGYNLPGGEAITSASQPSPLQKLTVEVPIPDPQSAQFAEPVRPIVAGVDGFSYRLETEQAKSNPLRLHITDVPVVREQEPNDAMENIQPVTVPCNVAGQWALPGDVDRFSFEATKGQVLWIEAFAQRLETTLDPLLHIEQAGKNADGNTVWKRLKTEDDQGTNLLQFVFDTNTDDPAYQFTAPEDGTYQVVIHDRYHVSRGSPTAIWRLSIRPPQPDFQLIVLPSPQTKGKVWPASLRRGDQFGIDVLVFRREGFNGEIQITTDGLPAGVSCTGTTIPAGSNAGQIVVATTEDATVGMSEVAILGTATIDSAQRTHTARAATIAWDGNGNNASAVSRTTGNLMVSVIAEPAPMQVTTTQQRFDVRPSRQVLIPLTLAKRTGFDDKVDLKVNDLPGASKIQFPNAAIEKGQTEALVRVFIPKDAPAGTAAPYLRAETKVNYSKQPQKLEQAKATQTAAVEREKSATAALPPATAAKSAAEQALAQAKQAMTAAQAKVNELTPQKPAADKALAEAQAQAVELTKQLEAAKDQQTKNAQLLAAAQAAQASDPANAELGKVVTTATALVTQTNEKTTALTAQATASQKVVEAAQAKAMEVMKSLAVAAQQLAEAKALVETKQPELAKLVEAEKQAQAELNASKTAKVQADNALKAAEVYSKPNSIAVHQPLPPFVFVVKPAPVELTAAVPDGGKLKPGAETKVKATIKRVNEFAGAVTLKLPMPPGVTGLTMPETTIPADQTEAEVTIAASADATQGAIGHLVLRAVADFDGEALVDVPMTLNVAP